MENQATPQIKVKKMPADESCLFSAVAYCLGINGSSCVKKMRALIASYTEQNPECFEKLNGKQNGKIDD